MRCRRRGAAPIHVRIEEKELALAYVGLDSTSVTYIVAAFVVLAVMGLAMSRAYALGKEAGEEKAAVSTVDRLLEKFREGYRDGSDHGSKTGAAPKLNSKPSP